MRRFLGVCAVALVLMPSAAWGHSNSVETNPEHGAQLDALPANVTISFDEAPKQVDAVLTTPDGKVHVLKPRIDGSTVIALLAAYGQRGRYGLSYRVVSADGHPVSGSATFTVTTGSDPSVPSSPRPTAPPTTSPTPRAAPELSDAAGDQSGLGVAPLALGVLAVAVVGLAALSVARRRRR